MLYFLKKKKNCSTSRVRHGGSWGLWEGKGLSLAFLPPITPRSLVGRDSKRALGTSQHSRLNYL